MRAAEALALKRRKKRKGKEPNRSQKAYELFSFLAA